MYKRQLLGFALFALVMYIGALPEGSKARQMLMPIRGELSIIAAILTVGHVANYLGTYLADILSGFAGMSAGMVASFVVSSPVSYTHLDVYKRQEHVLHP